jgi:hypothetical protein
MDRAKRPGRRHLLAAARHPARRDGVIALLLFVLPWVALLVVRRHHLDVGTVVAVISALAAASIGLSTLWLTWAALREAKRSGSRVSGLNLDQVADQLAIAVGAQWEAEVRVRRLNDPLPAAGLLVGGRPFPDRLLGLASEASDHWCRMAFSRLPWAPGRLARMTWPGKAES